MRQVASGACADATARLASGPAMTAHLPPPSLRRAVEAALPPLAGQVWQPLRGGRSNRLWRVGDAVVKLYRPEAASPLFPNNAKAEARALGALAGSGLAPRLRVAGSGWLVYDHSDGAVWSRDPAPVAQALARLHAHAAPSGLRRAPLGDALRVHARSIAALCGPGLPACPPAVGLPSVPPCFIHADAVPGNVIVHPGGITFIDWQCPALGDPVEDLATFLSPAMQWLYRGAVLTAAEAAAFLAAYPEADTVARYRVFAPLLHWRIAAHCLWKAERGDQDYRTALRLELDAL